VKELNCSEVEPEVPGVPEFLLREPDQDGTSQSPCDPALYPCENPNGTILELECSFEIDNGFEGTDFNTKGFYVMVYCLQPGCTGNPGVG